MKALTVYQPWATLIAIEAKPYEFRHWDYETRNKDLTGTRIAIHASARPVKYKEITELCESLVYRGGLGTALIADRALELLSRIRASMENKAPEFALPLSSIVCVATIGRARRATDLFKGIVRDSDRINEHVYAWPMIAVVKTKPIPCRGAQGFWNVPADLEREVKRL